MSFYSSKLKGFYTMQLHEFDKAFQNLIDDPDLVWLIDRATGLSYSGNSMYAVLSANGHVHIDYQKWPKETRPMIHVPPLTPDEEAIYDDSGNVLVEAYFDNAINRMKDTYNYLMQDYPIDTNWRELFEDLPF